MWLLVGEWWWGWQPITWGRDQQNWVPLGRGPPQCSLRYWKPDQVDRALNESPKYLRKKLYWIYHRSFRSCRSHVNVVKEETVLIHTTGWMTPKHHYFNLIFTSQTNLSSNQSKVTSQWLWGPLLSFAIISISRPLFW